MQHMSDALAAVMDMPMRPAGEVKIECDIIDVSAARQAKMSANSELYYSRVQHANGESAVPQAVTAVLEPMRFKADGSQRAAPAISEAVQINEGYISDALSGADGTFSAKAAPEISIAFTSKHSLKALTLIFDEVCGIYPKEIQITASCLGIQVYTKGFAPNTARYEINEKIEGFDAMQIKFISMYLPRTRARLQQIMFGRTAVYGSDKLGEVKCKYTLDPLMRRLPESTLSFEAVNVDEVNGAVIYDPDSPSTEWQYLEQPCPVRASYGIMCGGEMQWVPLGRFYLSGQPKAGDIFVTLTAGSVIDLLTDTCKTGTAEIKSRTLYDLAQQLLDEANIDMFFAGASRSLWEGLKSITVKAPVPQKTIRECLQYIAHAAGCALYMERSGTLCIQPVSGEVHDMRLHFDALLQRPLVSKNAAVSRAVCKVYTYTISAQGDVQSSAHTVTAEAQNAEPGAAEEVIDNPLITDDKTALACALRTRDYLLKRTVYECEYRGLPALEAGDIIHLQSRTAGDVPVRIAEHTLSFGNGVAGKIKAKKTEV